MKPTLRPMEEADVDRVHALIPEYVRELAGLPMEPAKHSEYRRYLRDIVDDPEHFVVIADLDGEVAGFADYRVHTGMQDRSLVFGEFVEFYVAKKCRRQKLGRALAQTAIKHMKKLGADLIDLGVLKSNNAGNSFWNSLGFRDRSVRKRLYL